MADKKTSFNRLVLFFSKSYYKTVLFLIILFFLVFYPGQNYYQVLNISWSPPKTISLPKQLSLSPAPYPKAKGAISAPNVSAKAVIVMDIPSSVVMFQKNPYTSLFPASTTKIMTALVALDYYKLRDILIVDKLESEGAKMDLMIGDMVTVESLIYGLLINSGNDAAYILAKNYPGGEKEFIKKMNEKAQEYALTRTHFENPNGFTNINHYSTALDLARLASIALRNPFISRVVSTKTTLVPDAFSRKYYKLENVNKLLGEFPGITGIKTGWTEEAGECLIASVERDGRRIVSVVLGSQDRFNETIMLLEWGFANFYWEEIQATHQ